jgi:PIN domain nuclease of toxin-antitoxin system
LKNRKATLKVLLDTSFLLPSAGISTGREILEALRKLSKAKAEIYYSRFGILEALWVAAGLLKNSNLDLSRFRLGLRSILESGKYLEVKENLDVFEKALELYGLGHKDLIDNILYADSVAFKLKLLTVDAELRAFIRKERLENTLLFPEALTFRGL